MLHATNAARRVRSLGAPAAPAPSSRPGVALPYRSKLALTFRSVSFLTVLQFNPVLEQDVAVELGGILLFLAEHGGSPGDAVAVVRLVQEDHRVRCTTQGGVAPLLLGGVLTGVVDDEHRATELSLEAVEVRDEQIHVLGGVLVATAEVAGKRVVHDQGWVLTEVIPCNLDHLVDLSLVQQVERRWYEDEVSGRRHNLMVSQPCFDPVPQPAYAFTGDVEDRTPQGLEPPEVGSPCGNAEGI